jgi:hypothetical protein
LLLLLFEAFLAGSLIEEAGELLLPDSSLLCSKTL